VAPPWPAPYSGRVALSTRKGLPIPGAATCLAGLIDVAAVIAATVMAVGFTTPEIERLMVIDDAT